MKSNDSNLRRGALAAATFALFAPGGTANAVDANKVIDLRVERLRVSGRGPSTQVLAGATFVTRTTVPIGHTISFTCDWSARLVGATYWKTNVKQTFQIVITRNDHTLATRSGVIGAGKQFGGKPGTDGFAGIGGTQAQGFGDHASGSTEPVKWTANEPGEHTFACAIPKTGFDEPTLENNLAHVIVEVQALKLAALPPLKSKSVVASATMQVSPDGNATGLPAVQHQALGSTAQPDLVSETTVTVGTQATQWGSLVKVDAANARRKAGGRCEFPIRHTVRNAGAGNAAAWHRRWTNDLVPGRWDMDAPALAPHATVERVDTLPLLPGRNVLYLTLDVGHALQESNTNNNLKRIAIDLTGACGGTLPPKKSAFNPSRW